MMNHRLRGDGQRSGMVILLVLICLIVITIIVGAMLRYLLLNSRQTKQRMHAAQAFWLADSGVERAVFSLRQNPAYRGETWNAAAESFAGKNGRVEIQVEAIPQDSSRVAVNVLASFPADSTFSVKARRQVVVAIAAKRPTVAQTTDEVNQDEE